MVCKGLEKKKRDGERWLWKAVFKTLPHDKADAHIPQVLQMLR